MPNFTVTDALLFIYFLFGASNEKRRAFEKGTVELALSEVVVACSNTPSKRKAPFM